MGLECTNPKMNLTLYVKIAPSHILLDNCVQTLGILMESSCNSCPNKKEETLHHIMRVGNIAAYVLKHAATMMGIFNVESETWRMKITRWFKNARKTTLSGKISSLLPVIII